MHIETKIPVDTQGIKIFDQVLLTEGWTAKKIRKDRTFRLHEIEKGARGIVTDKFVLYDEIVLSLLIRDRDDVEIKTLIPLEICRKIPTDQKNRP